MKLFITFIILLSMLDSFAQVPYQIKDINQGNENGAGHSSNGAFCSNGLYYFVGITDALGKELWVTDGTETGTHLVKDINVGSGDSFLGYYVEYVPFNNGVLFKADDGVSGNELWFTDGTEFGTYLVKDINPGVSSSLNSVYFTEFNGLVYFYANNGVDDFEVYVSDGTSSGTHLLKDINSGNSGVTWGYYVSPFIEFEGALYFVANDGTSGFELWKTDGTELGTHMLYDLNPGLADGFEYGSIRHIEYDHQLFFVGISSIYGSEVWKTDGTNAGTEILKDINLNGDAIWNNYGPNFHIAHGKIYFTAFTDLNGTEIWVSDGTNSGTQLFYDLQPGTLSGAINPKFYSFNNEIYFLGGDGVTYRDLWKTDGINLIKLSVNSVTSNGVNNLVELNNVVYFVGWSTHGHELWRTDGTAAGTYEVKDIAPGSSDGIEPNTRLYVYHDKLYFEARDIIYQEALWTSNGTAFGTYELMDPVSGNQLNDPGVHCNCCGNFYFTANEGVTGQELWGIDLNDFQDLSEEEVEDFEIYPNPSNGTFIIDNMSLVGPLTVDLFDVNMKLIYSQNLLENTKVEISLALDAGIYFARVSCSSGVLTKQIVIQ